jgi:GT2 family glycosyltransferase
MNSINELNPRPLECIIIIDGNNDLPIVKLKDNNTQIYKTGTPSGPSYARNLGAQHANGKILLFIDYDVIVPSNLILSIQNVFKTDSSLSALFGSYDSKPTDQSAISQYRNLLHHYVHQTSNQEAHTFWAGCGAIKKDIFDRLKGFDEKKYKLPSIEDIELGCRLTKHGYTINLIKDIQVTHQKKWDFLSIVKTDLFYRAIPWTKLILKEKAFHNDLNIKNKDGFSIIVVLIMLISFMISFLNSLAFLLLLILFFVFLTLNFAFYQYLSKIKGMVFVLTIIPLHILFYFICGLGFTIGTIDYFFQKIYE